MLSTLSRSLYAVGYQHIAKPLLFRIDPEIVHENMARTAQEIGSNSFATAFFAASMRYRHPSLRQTIAGITFANPIGLAAGFDYEAQLTQLLPAIGFGFETIGTITNHAYQGNPRPMLGRLPHSQSLMVNKGFKNLGAQRTIERLTPLRFAFPLGISIGRTNTRHAMSQKESVADIITAFTLFEKAPVQHAYYELNISCPNLYGNVSFYPPKKLNELLIEVDELSLARPLFIKMPIEKSDKEVLAMLEVIARHSPKGVIFGNLQKDRTDPAFDPSEVATFPQGNFSGRPTFRRSNELISLTYKSYRKRLVIIGCGGVFSVEDAYEKILRGASLVQLITGMIYQGPQLIGQINNDLVAFLKRDGFSTISEAVGKMNNKAR